MQRNKDKRYKIARVSTVSFFIKTQLEGQLLMHLEKHDVHAIASDDNAMLDKRIKFHPLHIERKVSLLKDLYSLIKLYKLFYTECFDIVHSTTPKAGLLSAIAATLTKTPVRLHTFTGQPWVEKKGFMRYLLKFMDRVIVKLTHKVYADSQSQADFLIKEGICKSSDISVLGNGSVAGIDLKRFNRSNYTQEDLAKIKISNGIDNDDKIVVFIGRITNDKGIRELIKAFSQLNLPKVKLLLVGPLDGEVDIDGQNIEKYIKKCNSICLTGHAERPEDYIVIADVLCLPSYREGFGTVIMEAAAMGVPSIGSDIYGLSDAIVNGETGILVPSKNVEQLSEALKKVLGSDELRKEMGANALQRAQSKFDKNVMSQLQLEEYDRFF